VFPSRSRFSIVAFFGCILCEGNQESSAARRSGFVPDSALPGLRWFGAGHTGFRRGSLVGSACQSSALLDQSPNPNKRLKGVVMARKGMVRA